MITTMALMSLYKSPTVRLDEICEHYLSLSRDEAYKQAARGELPLPTFRLTKSQKAPLLVNCQDLADLIDKATVEARTLWQHCQV